MQRTNQRFICNDVPSLSQPACQTSGHKSNRPTPATRDTSAWRIYNMLLRQRTHQRFTCNDVPSLSQPACQTSCRRTTHHQRRWILARRESTAATVPCHKCKTRIKASNAMLSQVCRSQPAKLLAIKANTQHQPCHTSA